MVVQGRAYLNPYSEQGAKVSGILSPDYMTGRSKANPSQLLTGKAIPDLSGIKLPVDTVSLSLPKSAGTGSTTEPPASPAVMQPQKMQTLDLSGLSINYIEPKYNLRGAVFCYDELQASKEFMEGLAAAMRETGAFSGALDYDDYAVMGLAEGQLRAFGSEQGFSKGQIEALAADYRESLRQLVEENLEKFPFERQVDHLPHSPYFFTYRHEGLTIDDRVIVKENALATGVDVAVNWNMIRDIYDVMSTTNVRDENALRSAVETFMQYGLEARGAGALDADWTQWRVGTYRDNIMKFQTAAVALREQARQKHLHLDINV